MKAVVLAGGLGTRLRPLTDTIPKPMAPIGGQPVLAHIFRLLARAGVTDTVVTLRYMPEKIRDYFGESFAGIRLTYRVEAVPRGTAGAVRDCADFLGDADFLVISGDCVCDFDLSELVAFHRARGAEATLALTENAAPTEYGIVVTDADGRVLHMIEKPAWEGVVTDCVNTGIYVLSPDILPLIPETGESDFSRAIFPQLLREGRRLYGAAQSGYWCDIGTPEAYRACLDDAENGRIRLKKQPLEAIFRHRAARDPRADAFLQTDAGISAPMFAERGVITLCAPLPCAALVGIALSAAAYGTVGVGRAGSEGARAAAELVLAGIAAGGGTPVLHDAPKLSEAIFAARLYRFPLSLFLCEAGGKITVTFLTRRGALIPHETERKILSGAQSEPARRVPGARREVSGVPAAYRAWVMDQLAELDDDAESLALEPPFTV
ncbi:MAG: NTP transferase domain-containing protein, partial [Oscillospiraceae bacterium]|nr:NTP transferase domain-containing protein [Oscillospiraceae bacterium]